MSPAELLLPLFLVSSLLWIGLAMLVGVLAMRRGSSGALRFLLALFTSPIVAVILLLILTPNDGRGGRP